LTRTLPGFLQRQRWFAGKAKRVSGCDVVDAIQVRSEPEALYFFFIRVDFVGTDSQTYVLPLQLLSDTSQVSADEAAGFALTIAPEDGAGAITFLDVPRQPDFPDTVLDIIGRGASLRGSFGELAGVPSSAWSRLRGSGSGLETSVLRAEQSNTSIVYGQRLILKMFRRAEPGVNPELEICLFLTERTTYTNFAAVAGALEYRYPGEAPASLAVVQRFVPNQGDAWKLALREVKGFFGRVAASGTAEVPLLPGHRLALKGDCHPPEAIERIGPYWESAELLGRRTAELHLALASDTHDSDFAPEPFTDEYQKAWHASMMGLVQLNLRVLRDRVEDLGKPEQELARAVLARERELRSRLDRVLDRKPTGMRTRVHGDYHLGQVLYTGSDFFIIDFEGEPERPLHERRTKSSPLRDVAGMLRSFDYAGFSAVFEGLAGDAEQSSQNGQLMNWARYWEAYVSAGFLRSYLQTAATGSFLPKQPEELQLLLEVSLLEKAIYELGYELNNRPTWARIPLQGILQILADEPRPKEI
jgi:maltose alpha-D-glucosyltransferase/alpha-amylase